MQKQAVVLSPVGEIGWESICCLYHMSLVSVWASHSFQESLLNLVEACELGLGEVRKDSLTQISVLCSNFFYSMSFK